MRTWSSLLDVVLSPKISVPIHRLAVGRLRKTDRRGRCRTDQVRRAELYGQAERILLNDQVAVICSQYYDRTVLVKNGVEFHYPPFGPPRFCKDWKTP